MPSSTADAPNSFRAFPTEERRAVFAGMIRDFVARDGRDETIRLLLATVFDPRTPFIARLPKEVAAALLAPFDPAAVRVEDCLADAEVDRILTGAGG
jgi:hypothetical protein